MHYLEIFLPNSTLTGMSYLYRFWTGDYMVWGSISLVAGFPQKRKFFGIFNCDFRKFHQRVFSDCMNMKNFEILVLTENSRYLQTAALKFLAKRLLSLSPRLNDYSISNIDSSLVETSNKLFDALVKPILPYGCEIWGPELLSKRHIFIKI